MTVQDYWETDFTTAEINPMVSLLVEDPWNVWLSVPERGLCHVTVNRNKFRTILAPSIADAGTNKLPYVSSVYLDDRNKLWISTYTGRTTRMDLQKNLSEDFYPIPAPFILINSIDQDEYGNLWFAIKEGALARTVNGKNNSPNFALYYYFFDPSNPASLSRRNEAYFVGKGSVSPHLYEHLLFKDSQGTLWFNSGRGIHDRYDPEMDGFIHLDHRQVDTYNNDSCFAAGTESEIWFPSARGLLRLLPPFSEIDPYSRVPAQTILYHNIPGDTSTLNSSWIRTLCFSRNYEPGTLWIGTIGGGLNKMTRLKVK